MKKFDLVGINSPGRVNLPGYGTIDLEKIDDKKAEKLWREGLPYLKPTPEYRQVLFPDQKPIEPTPAPEVATTAKPKTGQKKK